MGKEEVWWRRIPSEIFFRTSGMKGQDRWYRIETCFWSSSSDFIPKPLKPVIPSLVLTQRPDIDDFEFASLGPSIYASGGLDSQCAPSNQVFYIDTRFPRKGWKAAASMIMKRRYHYMLADSGKIYVFGGLDMRHTPVSSDNKKLYAEVYDPESDSWEELARVGDDKYDLLPKQDIYGHGVVDSGELDRKIILHKYFDKDLSFINTRIKDDVGVYHQDFGEDHPPSVFLDGFLYFFSKNRLYAYDISTCKGSRKMVLSDIKTNTLPGSSIGHGGMPRYYLISLGDKYLALIWALDLEYQTTLDVHCSIIEISKVDNTLNGKVCGCLTFSVARGNLQGGLAVFSRDANVDWAADQGDKTESSDKKQQQQEIELSKQQDQTHKRKFDQAVETDSTQHKINPCLIGNGARTFIWFDNCDDNGPLCQSPFDGVFHDPRISHLWIVASTIRKVWSKILELLNQFRNISGFQNWLQWAIAVFQGQDYATALAIVSYASNIHQPWKEREDRNFRDVESNVDTVVLRIWSIINYNINFNIFKSMQF